MLVTHPFAPVTTAIGRARCFTPMIVEVKLAGINKSLLLTSTRHYRTMWTDFPSNFSQFLRIFALGKELREKLSTGCCKPNKRNEKEN